MLVEEILSRTPQETIQKIYNLPVYSNTLEFLAMLSLSSGRLLKGGTPDVTSSARHVMNDWNHQKIPYFSVPPALHPSMMPSETPGAEAVGQAQILGELSAPFQLAGLFDAADNGAFHGDSGLPDVIMDEDGDEFFDANDTMQEDLYVASLCCSNISLTMSTQTWGNRIEENIHQAPSFSITRTVSSLYQRGL